MRSVARRPLRPPIGRAGGRLVHTQADLRSPEARRAVAGVDLLYHLGFQLWADPQGADGGDGMEAANVAGTANVLAGRPVRVVLASSAAVYGAWPDNPLPLTESARARPNRQCRYAMHKLTAERLCTDAAPTVALRIAAVLGPHADPAVLRAANGYRVVVPAVRGVTQALQFVDEDDAVAALTAAGSALCAGRASGAVNVGTEDWIDAAGIATVAGGRVLALPRRVLMSVSEAGRRAHLLPFGADRAVLLGGPMAVSVVRAASLLGWRPRRSSMQVLEAAVCRTGGDPLKPAGLDS